MDDLFDKNRFTGVSVRPDQQLEGPRRISTLELLSLAQRQNLSRTSSSSGSLGKWRARDSDLVRESRSEHLVARLKGSAAKLIPKTINDFRLSVQWTVALLLSSVPLYLNPIHAIFRGSEIFIPLSAVLTYDPTYGGHIRKFIDRVTCTLTAIIIALLFVAPLFLADVEEEPWVHWFIYGGSCAVPFFWSYAKALYPTHPTVPYAGIAASISFFEMNAQRNEFLRAMLFVCIATVIGSLIGSLVYYLVLPRRARSIIQTDLANALERVARILTPLVEVEAGLVRSPSFFKKSGRSASLLKKLSRSLSTRSAPTRYGSSSKAGCRMEMTDVEYAILEEFRDNLWDKVDEVNKLLAGQRPLLRPAEREYSVTKPHKFPSDQYLNLFENVRRIFFHVVSLYIALDAKTIALGLDEDSEDTNCYTNQMDPWAGSSVRIRSKGAAIKQTYQVNPPASRFLIPPSSLELHIPIRPVAQSSPLYTNDLPKRRLTSKERLILAANLSVPEQLIDLYLEEYSRIPLLKCANTYGPLIRQTCQSIVVCLTAISESLRMKKKNAELQNYGQRASQAMRELTQVRLKAQVQGQQIYDEVMRKDREKAADYLKWKRDVERKVDATIVPENIGLNFGEVKTMSTLEQAVVWNSFRSCIDRMTTVGRVLLTLTLELERCIANLNIFLNAMNGENSLAA